MLVARIGQAERRIGPRLVVQTMFKRRGDEGGGGTATAPVPPEGSQGLNARSGAAQTASADSIGAPAPIVERTKEGDQLVIPGAERITDRELAERRMAEPLRGAGEQRPADESLFDEGARRAWADDTLTAMVSKTPPPVAFTQHALTVLAERGISREWAERVLASPEWIEPDPNDATLHRAFSRVGELGGRVLRVVYHETRDERRVVTIFVDRTRRHGQPKARP